MEKEGPLGFSSTKQALKAQELPLFGFKVKTNRLATAASLSAFVAYLAYRAYKKSIAEGQPSHIATEKRIQYLQSSINQCNMSMNPADCKRKIKKQITKLKLQQASKFRKEKKV